MKFKYKLRPVLNSVHLSRSHWSEHLSPPRLPPFSPRFSFSPQNSILFFQNPKKLKREQGEGERSLRQQILGSLIRAELLRWLGRDQACSSYSSSFRRRSLRSEGEILSLHLFLSLDIRSRIVFDSLRVHFRKNYYDVLQVPKGASDEQIKRAYRCALAIAKFETPKFGQFPRKITFLNLI